MPSRGDESKEKAGKEEEMAVAERELLDLQGQVDVFAPQIPEKIDRRGKRPTRYFVIVGDEKHPHMLLAGNEGEPLVTLLRRAEQLIWPDRTQPITPERKDWFFSMRAVSLTQLRERYPEAYRNAVAAGEITRAPSRDRVEE